LRCKDCGKRLIKKYNIEYHKLGKVIELSKNKYICPNCQQTVKEKKCKEEMKKNILFPNEVEKIMQIVGITTEEKEALYELLLGKELLEITEDWVEKKTKELITMVSGLYPHEGNPCVIPKNKARDFICSFIDELALKIRQSNSGGGKWKK